MVIWTLPAKNDLRQIYNSIAYDSKIYAKRVTQNIAAKPYEVKPPDVFILAIVHKRRDLQAEEIESRM